MGKPSKQRPIIERRADGSIHSSQRVKHLVQRWRDGPLEVMELPTEDAYKILKKKEK